jgi:hypothetical protein
MQERREKNRRAQRQHRIRQQATKEAQRQDLSRLEKDLAEVMSLFLEFTRDVIQSDVAQSDLILMNNLRQAIKRMLSMVERSPHLDTCSSTIRGILNSASILDTHPVASPQPPHSMQLRNLRSKDSDYDPEEGPSLDSTCNAMAAEAATDSLDAIDWSTINLIRQPSNNTSPMASLQDSVSCNIQKPRIDNPFSLEITYLAIQNAYRLLSSAIGTTDEAICRVFGSALDCNTRQAILHRLQWHLGPGIANIDSVATASFVPATDAPNAHSNDGAVVTHMYNADTIARFLRQRTQGDANCDTLDIIIDPASLTMMGEAARLALLQKGFKLQHASALGVNGACGTSTEVIATVQVSRSRLLENVATSSICLGWGPAFSTKDFEQAILNSIINRHI